eukprot:scaffold98700_cov25-Tisochrysis_lutea.AAC.1
MGAAGRRAWPEQAGELEQRVHAPPPSTERPSVTHRRRASGDPAGDAALRWLGDWRLRVEHVDEWRRRALGAHARRCARRGVHLRTDCGRLHQDCLHRLRQVAQAADAQNLRDLHTLADSR